MESDHDHDDHQPTSEKATDRDGDGRGGSQMVTRSYECNFCKRGFSNAQALGGHMNIHRKDKAKLKQSSSLEERGNIPNWPWNVSQQKDHHAFSREESLTHGVVHMRQLPLFAESPSSTSTETQKLEADGGSTRGEIATDQRALSSADQGNLLSELDLELRLGPEPHDSSSQATGTRKFF